MAEQRKRKVQLAGDHGSMRGLYYIPLPRLRQMYKRRRRMRQAIRGTMLAMIAGAAAGILLGVLATI